MALGGPCKCHSTTLQQLNRGHHPQVENCCWRLWPFIPSITVVFSYFVGISCLTFPLKTKGTSKFTISVVRKKIMYLKPAFAGFLCSLKDQVIFLSLFLYWVTSKALTVLSQKESQAHKQTLSFPCRSSWSGGSTATKIIIKVDGVRIGISEQKSLYKYTTDSGKGLKPFVWKDEHKTLDFFSELLYLFIY